MGAVVKPIQTIETPVVALLVCLIPTTIGALLAAIGIAGMDRALQANIIAKSGKAVETAGDIDVVLLDKTGTITVGNRHATQLVPVGNFTATQDWTNSPLWLPSPTRHPKARASSSMRANRELQPKISSSPAVRRRSRSPRKLE